MQHAMRAQLIVSAGLIVAGVSSGAVSAQGVRSSPATLGVPKPRVVQASITGGRVSGLVRDDHGVAVPGAAISAVGTIVTMAYTDAAGRFVLPLPAGEYYLGARRDGYVSTYRDLVMVRPSSAIERTITVTRMAVAAPSSAPAGRPVMLAGTGRPVAVETAALGDASADHPHDETTWRLRHLKRPILRNTAPAVAEVVRQQAPSRRKSQNFFDWAFVNSARLTASFFANTDFSGQVNFLTTSAIDPQSGWSMPDVPASIAYLSVRAPVGSAGEWRVRGAMNATDLSSWSLLGEFAANDVQTHVVTAGMSYSTQAHADASSAALSAVARTSRSVGAVYASDHWSVGDDIELDYGLRWDRYSYVAESPNLFSPMAGLRARIVGGTSVMGQLAQRMVAPGSTEFQPPSIAGPWLPPERTFLSLATSGAFRAERVRHAEIGVEQAFDRGAVSVRRFRQASDDQTSTLFGVNDGLGWSAGVYSVAAVGAVVADGWAVRAEGAPSSRLSGTLEYSIAHATWLPGGGGSRRAQALVPSVVRSGLERVHDLQASLDVHIPESATDLAMTYRLNTAFSRAGQTAAPGPGVRFDMQVNQALPFQPVRGGRLEVLVAVSNLFRDSRQAGSIFDELLTVAPPLRILGGFQLRF